MTEKVKCDQCGEQVDVDREKWVVVCPMCGRIVYRRVTDYLRENWRTKMGERKREREQDYL